MQFEILLEVLHHPHQVILYYSIWNTFKRNPNRFIPVGQDFCERWSGGTITFKNSQRGFHKEDDATYSNVMFKTKKEAKQPWRSNENDVEIEITVKGYV
jgi:hypothetical protein